MSKHLKLPTLLLVTDNPSIRFWVKKHLEDQFFIISAEKRQEALDALHARLDFIIVDAALEDSDALDLCKNLSQLTHNGLVPILLVTGRLKKSFRDRALESGVTDFLSDQLDLEELETRIATGRKAAAARQKTEDLSLKIQVPKQEQSNQYLKNKFLLNDQALRLLAAAKNEGTPTVLLFMRIDPLKQKLTDALLAPFSDLVRSLLRKNDLLIPSSEGGFIILLPNTTSNQARSVAELLQKTVQHHRFNGSQLTISMAISPLEASEKGFNQMIDAAVKSLKAHSETNLIISLDQETL